MKVTRLVLSAIAMLACFAAVIPSAQSQGRPDDAVSIYRVYVDDQADIDVLLAGGYDLVESRGIDYLLVVGDAAVASDLRRQGFRVSEERQLEPIVGVPRHSEREFSALATTYYGGYRTVDEHFAHLTAVETTFPGLALVVDYGDSWRKVNGQPGGNDLMAICLTNRQTGDCALNPNSTKPRAVIMAAIHARELQTSEVAWRLIDELTQQYGVDPDITHIMDTTETWVIPVVNPDGREIVEGGGNAPYLQRKNANNSLGNCAVPPTASNQHGVDLNRNASYQWGGIGTTSDPCAQTYRGTSAASEPEQASLQTLFSQLWPDQNTSPSVPVPSTATGTFITLHSYGNLVLLPPGAGGVTPNDTELRTLAFRMSHYNGYQTGTGPEILYGTTGTTDDWTYSQLGVASFTFELSPSSGSCSGFTPAYSCIDSSVWPTNRNALLYSLKVAGSPYVTPRGPTTTTVSAPNEVSVDSTFDATAVIDDNALGTASGSINRPSAATVTEAEYYLDLGPSQGGTPLPLNATDGAFNSVTESVVASVSTSGMALGEHTLFVRGRNAGGFWGPVSAVSFTVVDGPIGSSEVASSDTAVFGTVSGSLSATWTADGVSQTITETESGGKPANRHDQAEHRWSIPAAGGNQTLVVVASATDAGDADNGFAIEWSNDGSAWIPVTTVSAGAPVDGAFDIGTPTGTVWVRAGDTDRTAGERLHDSVAIDLLRVDGDGTPGGPTDPTLAVASITTSTQGAGQGRQFGVATVQVNDDQGGPVAGASVTIDFTGDFAESVVVSTNSAGSATAITATSIRKPVFAACVSALSAAGLTYAPGTEAC